MSAAESDEPIHSLIKPGIRCKCLALLCASTSTGLPKAATCRKLDWPAWVAGSLV